MLQRSVEKNKMVWKKMKTMKMEKEEKTKTVTIEMETNNGGK